MYSERDFSILEHIVRYCEKVERTLARLGHSYENFLHDTDLFDAISMNILQIGELSSHLSDEFRASTQAEIPWRQIKDMRNRFAHGYWTMSPPEIFHTASKDLPALKEQCKALLEKRNP